MQEGRVIPMAPSSREILKTFGMAWLYLAIFIAACVFSVWAVTW